MKSTERWVHHQPGQRLHRSPQRQSVGGVEPGGMECNVFRPRRQARISNASRCLCGLRGVCSGCPLGPPSLFKPRRQHRRPAPGLQRHHLRMRYLYHELQKRWQV